MKPSRWFALAAVLGGVLCVIVGALILFNPEYYLFDSFAGLLVLIVEGAALLSVSAALTGFYALTSESLGRLGLAGFLSALAGTVLAGSGHILGLPFFDFINTGSMVYVLIGFGQGIFTLSGTAYVVGAALMSLGYLLLGIATSKAGILPRLAGLLLIAGIVALWFGNAFGWILFGLTWLCLAYAGSPGEPARLEA